VLALRFCLLGFGQNGVLSVNNLFSLGSLDSIFALSLPLVPHFHNHSFFLDAFGYSLFILLAVLILTSNVMTTKTFGPSHKRGPLDPVSLELAAEI
jgi:hypothetical protein